MLVATLFPEACAMGQKVLFSEVQGIVVRDGAPVGGAVVERSYLWAWNDKRGSDSAVTDQQGAFRVPVITGRSFLGGVLPHEPAVDQTIHIRHEGKTYEAWVFSKRNYDGNGELNGKPLRLHCDLSSPPKRTETGPAGQGYFGICELR